MNEAVSNRAGVTGAGAAGGLGADVLVDDPERWRPRLEKLLDEQRDLCKRLDVLSREQGRTVGDGDTDGLLRVLSERQTVIDRVGAVNTMLEPFRVNRQAAMARLTPPQREAIQVRITQIADLVEGVRTRDEADRKSLETQRNQVAEELSGLARGRGAVAAYGPAQGSGGPRFQDRKG